jgi:hypothetical protein
MRFLLALIIFLVSIPQVLPGESRYDSPGHALSKFDDSIAEIVNLL